MKRERMQKSINRIRSNLKTAHYCLRNDYYMEGDAFRGTAINIVLTLAEMLEVEYDELEFEFRFLVDKCIAGGSDEWDDKRESRSAIAQFLNETFGIDWAEM